MRPDKCYAKLLDPQSTDYVLAAGSDTSPTVLSTDVCNKRPSATFHCQGLDSLLYLAPGSDDCHFGCAKISLPLRYLALDDSTGDRTCLFSKKHIEECHTSFWTILSYRTRSSPMIQSTSKLVWHSEIMDLCSGHLARNMVAIDVFSKSAVAIVTTEMQEASRSSLESDIDG